ncbi:hypothetical protein EYE42_05945 [Paracoccus subflavus]|uniref:Uncharacterized protein n=1 Tax=Paracoccus subflavus TaxID=2528244 RepID=A0A4Q9G7R4_9RHOB|nr:hypothetical protein [Paracoccus subflavus]TBN41940.1 hypothetical protein EYE42_05945 [Paracoccus subflavus]
MIRIVVGLILAILCMAGPSQACGPNASSTFCADGWVAQPVSRTRAQDERPASEQAEDWTDDGTGPDPSFSGGGGIYVEGAVTIGEAPVPVEEPL